MTEWSTFNPNDYQQGKKKKKANEVEIDDDEDEGIIDDDDLEIIVDDDETEVEDDEGEVDAEPDADDDDSEEDGEDEKDSEEEDSRSKKSERKTRRRGSRQRDSEKARLEERNNALQNSIKEIRDELSSFKTERETTNLDQQIQAFQNEMDSLDDRYAEAMENNDAKALSEINRKVSDLTLKKTIAEAEKKSRASKANTTRDDTRAGQQGTDVESNAPVPPAYLDWVEDNVWFEEPQGAAERRLKRFAEQKAWELADKDPKEFEYDDFYDDLNKEIKNYVKKKKLKVEGFEDLLSSDNDETSTRKKRRKSPTQPRNDEKLITKTKDGKLRVSLTADEKEIADRLGVSLEQYAKRKFQLKNSKKSKTGYTPIFGE